MTRRLATLALAGGTVLLGGAAPPATATVSLTIDGLRSARGLVQVCLTADPVAFPDCRKDRHSQRMKVPAGEAGELTFAAVPYGRWAISLLHDENGNGKVDKALLLPREGFGFSRNAPVRFGPPSFGSAAFEVGDAPVHQSIHVRYLL